MSRDGAALAALAAGAIAAAACTNIATSFGGKPGPEAGLLRGRSPSRAEGVTHVDRLTDGIAAAPDDPPRTELTSLFASPAAFVSYDLGAETAIDCAAIDADGDDVYALAVSSDGVAWTLLWKATRTDSIGTLEGSQAPRDGLRRAEPVYAPRDPGMQPRAARGLGGRGRFVRLSAAGGDGVYAVAELSVAAECPPRWPPVLAPQQGTPIDRSARTKVWAFAALAAAYVVGYRRKLPDFVKLLIAVPVGIGLALAFQLADIWPLPWPLFRDVSAAVVIVGAALAIRVVVSRRRRPS
jgi:hypothetical protein